MKELKEFRERAEEGAGLTIGDKSRVFKVIKTHIPPDEPRRTNARRTCRPCSTT
jgi:hypothetical protein